MAFVAARSLAMALRRCTASTQPIIAAPSMIKVATARTTTATTGREATSAGGGAAGLGRIVTAAMAVKCMPQMARVRIRAAKAPRRRPGLGPAVKSARAANATPITTEAMT